MLNLARWCFSPQCKLIVMILFIFIFTVNVVILRFICTFTDFPLISDVQEEEPFSLDHSEYQPSECSESSDSQVSDEELCRSKKQR